MRAVLLLLTLSLLPALIAPPAAAVVSDRDALELERRLWAAPELADARFTVGTRSGRLLVAGRAADRATRERLRLLSDDIRDAVAPSAPLDVEVVIDPRRRPWAYREASGGDPLAAVRTALEADALAGSLDGLLSEARLEDGVLHLAATDAWPQEPSVERRLVRLLRAQPEVRAVRVPQLAEPPRRLAARDPFAGRTTPAAGRITPANARRATRADASRDTPAETRDDTPDDIPAVPSGLTIAETPGASPSETSAEASADTPATAAAGPTSPDADDALTTLGAGEADTPGPAVAPDGVTGGNPATLEPSPLDLVLQDLLVASLSEAAGPGALLEVKVVDNVAVVGGTVADEAAARRVHEAAWRGDGIRRVEGRLRIGNSAAIDLSRRPVAVPDDEPVVEPVGEPDDERDEPGEPDDEPVGEPDDEPDDEPDGLRSDESASDPATPPPPPAGAE